MKSYQYQRQILFSILLILAGLAWVWLTRSPVYTQNNDTITAPQMGFAAPDFSLQSISSTDYSLSALKGKPVIINFWASWCPPCRAEMPAFQKAFLEYQSSDIVILGINATDQDQPADVVDFVGRNNISFPILLDHTGIISRSYHLYSLPTTFFIDRSGIIQKVIIGGPIPLSLLRVQINYLLKEH